MALLAEELVEEWLNRQGYFTIRGIKLGVNEMDLLALRTSAQGLERRHIEVQASVNPVAYITQVPKAVQLRSGRAPGSAKVRDDVELRAAVQEWIQKKFDHPRKAALRLRLAAGPWSRELIVHKVKHLRELELLTEAGVQVRQLSQVVSELKHQRFELEGASGTHLVDLVAMADSFSEPRNG